MNFKVDEKIKQYFGNNLRQVFMYLIDSCNLNCVQCLYKLDMSFQVEKKEIALEDAINLISDFREMGAVKLTLMGGEPTLYGLKENNEPLLKLIKKSKELGYEYVRIDTNGMFNPSLLERPEFQLLDEITFSLDGPNAEINDPIRGKGSFEKCLKTMKRAKELGYNINITTCISKELVKRDENGNLYLDRMIKFAEELGTRINFHNLFKTGVPRDHFSGNLDIPIKEWISVWGEIQEKISNDEYKIPVRIPQSFTTKKEFERNPEYYGYCSCKSRSRVLVHPNGIMRTCSLMIGTPYGIGRYYDGKMEWDNSPTNELLAHKFDENTPCTNQYKNNKYGEFVPTCVSFKPGQSELIWKELEWEKRRIDNKDRKIKTFIQFQDKQTMERVVNSVKESDVAEIVGTSDNNEDALMEIIKLKPDMVFMEYKKQEINSFDIIKRANEEMKIDIPVFNIIGENIPREPRIEVLKIIGSKMNAVIEKEDFYEEQVKDILKEYKEYDFK